MSAPQWLRDTARLRTNGVCWYCGCELQGNNRTHIDHMLPIAQGGPDVLENLAPSCSTCNQEKYDLTVDGYRLKIERRQANMPYFTPKQREWLKGNGFDVDEHRPKGHRFYFEIHEFDKLPLPSPEDAGWLTLEPNEEVHRAFLALRALNSCSMANMMTTLVHEEAKRRHIIIDTKAHPEKDESQ